MDPRIKEYLERRLSEDEREIQVLGELRSGVDKLENYLRMYMLQEEQREKVNRASKDEKVDCTRMTQQWHHNLEPATGRGGGWSSQMYTPMNQASQSEDVGSNRMSQAAKHVLESATGRGGEWSTETYTPMNHASQSEGIGSNRMSQAAKHVLESESPNSRPNFFRHHRRHLGSSNEYKTPDSAVPDLPDLYHLHILDKDATLGGIEQCTTQDSEDEDEDEDSPDLSHFHFTDTMGGMVQHKTPYPEYRGIEKCTTHDSEDEDEDSPDLSHFHFTDTMGGMVQPKTPYPEYRDSPDLSHFHFTDTMGGMVQHKTPYPEYRGIEKCTTHDSDDEGDTHPNVYAPRNAERINKKNREKLNAQPPHQQGPSQIRHTDQRRYRRKRYRPSSTQKETHQDHAYMQSPMVQKVPNKGVDRDRVRNVIERRLRDTDESETASSQKYTPMNQTPKADGDDWNRMAQVAKTTSKSGNIGPYSQSEDRYRRFHEQEEKPSSYNAQTSSMSKQIHNASSRSSRSPNSHHQGVHALMQSPIVQSVLNTGVDRNCVRTVVEKMLRETGNTYPNAEALMNAVLNYEQTRGASYCKNQGPPKNPQTDEHHNARRRPRSSGHQEEASQTQACMQSPMVQSVLNTGVDRDRVKNVIERRLRDKGNTYPNAEALMNAVLNYEHTSGKIDTSSSHHHGHPQNPQTDELCNGRRRSKSSTSNEGETMSAQKYTPMNQSPKADGNDCYRMAQVAKTTSKSGKAFPETLNKT
nr:uncharacterized protein LOC105344548 isoform X3 [Crassostrea gigas]